MFAPLQDLKLFRQQSYTQIAKKICFLPRCPASTLCLERSFLTLGIQSACYWTIRWMHMGSI